ncbi:hypothetical protein TNCV_5015941 [Trichonephila clavipes]|nr:hypothetical protein TNCV_5015941 [Trichonephila clavipes]
MEPSVGSLAVEGRRCDCTLIHGKRLNLCRKIELALQRVQTVQLVMTELRYECITSSFGIDKCRITQFFCGYIVNLVKQEFSRQFRLDNENCLQSKPLRKDLKFWG